MNYGFHRAAIAEHLDQVAPPSQLLGRPNYQVKLANAHLKTGQTETSRAAGLR